MKKNYKNFLHFLAFYRTYFSIYPILLIIKGIYDFHGRLRPEIEFLRRAANEIELWETSPGETIIWRRMKFDCAY